MKNFWNMGLNPDGSEKINTEKAVIPLKRFGLSADQKLKQMLARELAKDRMRDETMLDDHDFDLPDEDSPPIHFSVDQNPISAREIKERINEQRKLQQEKSKQTGDGEPVDRKPAKTGPAGKPVAKHNNKSSSAGESPDEVADDE